MTSRDLREVAIILHAGAQAAQASADMIGRGGEAVTLTDSPHRVVTAVLSAMRDKTLDLWQAQQRPLAFVSTVDPDLVEVDGEQEIAGMWHDLLRDLGRHP
jgi:hypothetical protein